MPVPAWVSEIGVAAQIVIAFSAIWGEKVRARLARPRLRLIFATGTGDAEPRELPDEGHVTVRYCRLEVHNRTLFSVANEVQVFITRIARREPSGHIRTEFTGAVPLEWQHQELYQAARNIGHSTVAVVNLLFLYSDFIELTPMIKPVPVNFGDRKPGAQNFWITVLARGLNAESTPIQLEVRWDGNWEPGDAEMAGHFSITIAPLQT